MRSGDYRGLSGEDAIVLRVVPVTGLRYKTLGDWYNANKWQPKLNPVKIIESVDLHDSRMEFAILVHELVESVLCEFDGVSQQEVDEYDFQHEQDEEPGENPDAPYHKEHMVADKIEHIIIEACGLTWTEYEDYVEKIWPSIEKAVDKKRKRRKLVTAGAPSETT